MHVFILCMCLPVHVFICSSKLTVFLELRSRKTVRFSEQIMSVDKYLCIFFAPNGGYCLYTHVSVNYVPETRVGALGRIRNSD